MLFLVAFLEGGAVMAVELAGAKLVAPYYGISMYVWSSVLAVTLGGLTLGYFLGGWASSKIAIPKLLALELFFGVLFITLMPFTELSLIPATLDFGVRSGSLISSFLLLMPP